MKLNSFLEKEREEAYRSLDRLFEIEAKAYALRGKMSKENAASALFYLRDLGRLFPLTVHSLIDPYTPSEKDDDDGDGGVPVNEWRNAVAFLIQNHIPIPKPMARSLATALSALNVGEIQGVVRASVTGKRTRAWAISRLQLAAIVHTYFLVGHGYRVSEALRQVAEAYGYHENGANTLRSWGTRELKRIFGSNYLTYIKKAAREAGAFHRKGSTYDQAHTPENSHVWFLAHVLELDPLKSCAALYKASLQGREVRLPFWLENLG